MARIELAPEVADDFDRIIDYLRLYEVENPVSRIVESLRAIDALEPNPRIGRIATADKRELNIGRDSRGYVALYRYIARIDTIFVLAIRSQREAGYARG